MSIASRIQSIEEHIKESYQELEGIGIDTTEVDKNLENIPKLIDGYWETLPKVTGEGTSITLDNTKEGKMKIGLKGNTSQETTTGKNLANYSNWEQGNFYVEGAGINGNVESANVIRMNDFINVKPSTTYTLSCNTTIGQFGYVFKDTNGNITGAFQNTGTKYYTFTTPSNVNQIRLRIGNSSYPKTYGNNYQIQLEENNQATPYEEYTGGQPSPSPDYPQDIHVVSGDNEIVVTGKNLISTNLEDLEQGSISGSNGENFSSNNRVRNNKFFNFNYDEIQPNHVWLVPTGYKIAIRVYDQNKNFVGTLTYSGFLGDLPSAYVGLGIKYIKIVYAKTDDSNITPNDIANLEFMISKGNNATYEPYKGASYPINLGNIELCKIGDYQDSIVKDNGKWYLNKQIGKAVLDGTETGWSYPSANRFNLDNYVTGYLKETYKITYLSDQYVPKYQTTANAEFNTATANLDYAFNFGSGASNNIRFKDTRFTSVNEFKAELALHNLTIYYVLATSTYTQITDTTLINQLEALNGAKSYTNQTNISQENNDNASILNASALESM